MAATLTTVLKQSKPKLAMTVYDIDLGTYATGGVTVTPTNLGLSSIVNVFMKPKTPVGTTAGGYSMVGYNHSTFKAWVHTTTGVELGLHLSLADLPVRAVALGY